ncbi:MAG: ferritin family protein [Candidatus Micrarchaeota archaeon]
MAGKKKKDQENFLISAFKSAISIEKKGIDFYSRAIRKVRDPNGKAVLEFLVSEEKRHLQFFETLARRHAPAVLRRQVKILKRPRIFPKPIEYHKRHEVAMDMKIMEEAIKTEKKSIALYESYKRELKGRELRSALQLIIDEEKQHLNWFEFARGDAKLHSYWAELEEHFSIQG